jgi:hypothetical protein
MALQLRLMFTNDDTKSPIVTIISDPANGIAVVNVDKTTYTHNGNSSHKRFYSLPISNGLCASSAKITVIII